jgi:D-alanine-D-alanine ligase
MPTDRFAELDDEATVAAIERALQAAGHEVVRIGALPALLARLAAGPLGVDLVFNVAEGVRGVGREAQVPALLEAFGVPYTGSDPLALAVTLAKGVTKRLWRDAGLPTAPFAVAHPLRAIEAPAPYPLFVKPVAEGSSMGVSSASLVRDRAALERAVRRIWDVYAQGALIEAYLPGAEFTVGVVDGAAGPEVLGALALATGEIWAHDEKHAAVAGKIEAPYRNVTDPALRDELAALALAAHEAVGCRDVSRVDLRADAAGRPHLLEVNALPGLVPGRSLLSAIAADRGWSYADLIAGILHAAARRTALNVRG